MTAQELYETVAQTYLNDTSPTAFAMKSRAVRFFFDACICRLALNNDDVAVRHALSMYCEAYPAFKDSMEFGLLSGLMDAAGKSNIDAFRETLASASEKMALHDFETQVLRAVEMRLESSVNDFA